MTEAAQIVDPLEKQLEMLFSDASLHGLIPVPEPISCPKQRLALPLDRPGTPRQSRSLAAQLLAWATTPQWSTGIVATLAVMIVVGMALYPVRKSQSAVSTEAAYAPSSSVTADTSTTALSAQLAPKSRAGAGNLATGQTPTSDRRAPLADVPTPTDVPIQVVETTRVRQARQDSVANKTQAPTSTAVLVRIGAPAPPQETGQVFIADTTLQSAPLETAEPTRPSTATATLAPAATATSAPAATPSPAPTHTLAPSATPTPRITLEPVAANTSGPTPLGPNPASPTRLIIPGIGLEAPIITVGYQRLSINGQAAVSWAVPAYFAAGWHHTSAPPGQAGNTVLNGHQSIHGAVFRDLGALETDDEIIVLAGDTAHHYRVSEQHVLKEEGLPLEVRAQNAHWIMPTGDERLTLVTCAPDEKSTHRLIVVALPVAP